MAKATAPQADSIGDVPASPDFSFTRRPVWLLGHLVALTAVVGFVLLGMWQLDRHDARSRTDAVLAERLDAAPVPLETLLPLDDIAAAEFVPVEATGTYVTAEEVVLQARSLGGVSGHEVLTPLRLDNGAVVVVDRGWVQIDAGDPPVAGAEPPGEVTVTGYLRPTQVRQGIGPTDPPTGELARVSRVDLERLTRQIEGDLLPMWIQLSAQDPAQPEEYPRIVPPPAPGEGPPHMSYAVQWFLFAAVVLAGYPILLRHTAASRGRDGSDARIPVG